MDLLSEIERAIDTHIAYTDILIRLVCACIFSFAIGFDREYRNHPAGLRTHLLVALAAAVFALIALEMVYGIEQASENARLDPIRVVEAVTAGVAFLAAGAIIYSGGNVLGLTTGAGMWLSGAIGLACGAGYLGIAFLATVFAVTILVPLRRLESRLPREDDKNSES